MAIDITTGRQARLWFTLPDQMYPIDIDEDSRQRATRTYEHLMRTMPGLTPARCLRMVGAQEDALAVLRQEGAAYLATCLATSDAEPGTLAMAQFGILMKAMPPLGDRPLESIAQRLAAQPKRRDITFAAVPAGPVLIVDEAVDETVFDEPPSAATARCAQVILPFPDRSAIASLMLSSTALADWPGFVDLLLAVARSITFTEPGTD